MQKIAITKYMGANFVRDVHLLALEIAEANRMGKHIVLDLDYEGWDIVETGIEKIVKDIADRLCIPYNRIQFRTNDMLAKSEIFVNKYCGWNEALRDAEHNNIQTISFPAVLRYGQFLGRADNNRMYGHYKHINNRFKNQGVATFHHDPMIVHTYTHQSEFIEFCIEHNTAYKQILPNLPYSDLGIYLKPPIVFGNHMDIDFWKRVYKNITVELAYETVPSSGTFYPTEKTFRPIQYGKLFMIAAGRDYEKHLAGLGFDIFDDIIDKSYDSEEYYIRIDMMFNSLNQFLQSNYDVESLHTRLKRNQDLLCKLVKENAHE